MAVFQSFLSALGACEYTADASQAFSDACGEMGFDAFAYLGFPSATMDCSPSRVVTTYPISWRQHYFDQGYDRLDPVVRMAQVADLPFSWGVGGADVPIVGAREHQMFQEAADVGIRFGLTVPIRDRVGRLCTVSVCSARENWYAELGPEGFNTLHLMAIYFHAHLARLESRASVRPQALSPREQACLIWASRGKSADETGALLGISKRTVHFHLGNAKCKLGAATIAEAVAMATSDKVIVCMDG